MKSQNQPPSSPDKPPRSRSAKPGAGSKTGTRSKKAAAIPPILLEGDETPASALSGPGQRYAVGQSPAPGRERFDEKQDLPEAYGTGTLFLTARDPHWLYAQWDFTRDQLKTFNRLSVDGHLILRIHAGEPGGKPFLEVHLHPESRNWFVHVGRGDTRYMAELGYYDRRRKWTAVAASTETVTPPDELAQESTARFATIPIDVPLKRILQLVKRSVHAVHPMIEAVRQLGSKVPRALSTQDPADPPPSWTQQQEKALEKVLSIDKMRRVWIGSLEITELIRRQLESEISSAAAATFSLPTSIGQESSFSQALGHRPRPEHFWFQVNAELIVYGATEKDAQITIGGRAVKLRPDGTFSYRFSLPDGEYELPISATAASGKETRSALLNFSRKTANQGEVGQHPQDPSLKSPSSKNLS